MKFTLEQTMKAHRRRKGRDLLFFKLGARWGMDG